MNISTECYQYIESFLGCKADLPLEDIISILSSILVIKILSNIKFENKCSNLFINHKGINKSIK